MGLSFAAGNDKISGLQLALVTRLRLSLVKTIKFMSGDNLMRECTLHETI